MARSQENTNHRWIRAAVLMLIHVSLAQAAETADTLRVRRQILVSIPDRKLAVIEEGNVIATFDVAVGAPVSPSPVGKFAIVSRLANPTYYHAGAVIAPGDKNPVGPRWLGLDRKGYGIHGTNQPRSIKHAASHGCIRLRNQDIKKLYEMVHVGDSVEICAERDKRTQQIFGGAQLIASSATAAPVAGQ